MISLPRLSPPLSAALPLALRGSAAFSSPGKSGYVDCDCVFPVVHGVASSHPFLA